jgi:DNA-binding transcriptional LysR family regulator
VQLFERSGRGLALTSVGRLFQEYAQAGVTSLQQAIDSVALGRVPAEPCCASGPCPPLPRA